MNRGVWARWKAWIALDDQRPAQAGSREARIDDLLREGAADQIGEGDGRLRWRVLGAISAKQDAPQSERSVVGRIGWRFGALAACAVIALGFGALWFGPSAPQAGSPTTDSASIQTVQPTPTVSKFPTMALLQNPMATLAAQLDQPLERQTQQLMTDARKLAGFFAERVTAPIAALHRAGTAPDASEAPLPDDLHSGGA